TLSHSYDMLALLARFANKFICSLLTNWTSIKYSVVNITPITSRTNGNPRRSILRRVVVSRCALRRNARGTHTAFCGTSGDFIPKLLLCTTIRTSLSTFRSMTHDGLSPSKAFLKLERSQEGVAVVDDVAHCRQPAGVPAVQVMAARSDA